MSDNKSSKTIIIAAAVGTVFVVMAAFLVYYILKDKGVGDNGAETTAQQISNGTFGSFPGDANHPDKRFHSFDWLSETRLSSVDLSGITSGDLRLLRNAIYAKHGYIFPDNDLTEFFSRFNWYKPTTSSVKDKLSPIEQDNISFIENYEGNSNSSSVASAAPAQNPAPAPAPAPKPRSSSHSGGGNYMHDYTNLACYTWLTPADLAGYSKSELRKMRNTIYARHGRRFKKADLRAYFNGFAWYYPVVDEISPSVLSSTEKHNIQLIKRYE